VREVSSCGRTHLGGCRPRRTVAFSGEEAPPLNTMLELPRAALVPAPGRVRRGRRRRGQVLWAIALCLTALAGVCGVGEQGAYGTRCMADVLSADGGRVVVYDTVVSVPMRRLFLIGPHKPLWVVPTVPAQQANTVAFAKTFDARPNPDTGSTCRFALARAGPGAQGTQGESADHEAHLVSTMGFIHDAISNVNVAFCSVPDAAMTLLLQGEGTVSATVTLVPLEQSAARVVLDELPVCVAHGAGVLGRAPVYASLCCIIRNEARYLEEWIEYSRMIGVEHFYLYDHASSDNTSAVLSGYISAGIVTLHQWEFPGYPQREAHSHCTHRYAHATTWLGLMDVDEFIVPVRAQTLVPLLHFFDQEPIVLRLQAAMFGTSGHVLRPVGLVVENYVMRNVSTQWPINPQHKVWFRPGSGLIMLPSIHAVDVFSDGVTHLDVHEHDAYYNHYRTKSHADHKDDPLRSNMEILEADQVLDERVRQRFLTPLRERLRRCRDAGPCCPGPAPCTRAVSTSALAEPQDAALAAGQAAVGHALPATFLARSRSHFDECPEVADAVLRLLPRPRHVQADGAAAAGAHSGRVAVDLDPGTGFYLEYVRQHGVNATGLDADGELSAALADADLREVSTRARIRLHPKPYIYILNPKPQDLNPNPKPQTQTLNSKRPEPETLNLCEVPALAGIDIRAFARFMCPPHLQHSQRTRARTHALTHSRTHAYAPPPNTQTHTHTQRTHAHTHTHRFLRTMRAAHWSLYMPPCLAAPFLCSRFRFRPKPKP